MILIIFLLHHGDYFDLVYILKKEKNIQIYSDAGGIDIELGQKNYL